MSKRDGLNYAHYFHAVSLRKAFDLVVRKLKARQSSTNHSLLCRDPGILGQLLQTLPAEEGPQNRARSMARMSHVPKHYLRWRYTQHIYESGWRLEDGGDLLVLCETDSSYTRPLNAPAKKVNSTFLMVTLSTTTLRSLRRTYALFSQARWSTC